MRRQKDTSSTDLREVLNGEVLRQIIDLEDEGRLHVARVKHQKGDDPVEVDADRREIRVETLDVVNDHPSVSTLLAAASALWRKPPVGATVLVLRGANTGGPGAAFVFHGDGGNDGDVPESLDDTNTVLSPPTGYLLLESRDGDAVLQAKNTSKKTRLGAADADQSAVRGDAYLDAEDPMLSQVKASLIALATAVTAAGAALTTAGAQPTYILAAPFVAAAGAALTAAGAAQTAAATAIGTFQAGKPTYKSSRVKVK